MKNALIALAVAVAACGLAAAQQPVGGMEMPAKSTMKHEKKEMKSGKMKEFKGTVQAIDAVAGKLTVTDKKGMTMALPVTDETKVIKSGKAAVLGDLMVGEMVHIKYEGDINSPIVKKIKVKKARMNGEKAEKTGKMQKTEPMEKRSDKGGAKN